MFIRDKTIRLGSTHEVCEDYALCGENNGVGYLIVSDGCSSSPDTDIGARVLSRVAEQHIEMIMTMNVSDYAQYYSIGKSIALMSGSIINQIGIPENLDATMIIALELSSTFIVLVYGDGFVFHRNKEVSELTGSMTITKFDYPVFVDGREKTYPFYLSYLNDRAREQTHADIVGVDPVTRTIWTDCAAGSWSDQIAYPRPIIIQKKGADIVGISTDGLDTFTSSRDGSRVDYPIIVDQLIALKSRRGKFLQRRVNKMLRQYSKNDVHHIDDIGLAMFAHVED